MGPSESNIISAEGLTGLCALVVIKADPNCANLVDVLTGSDQLLVVEGHDYYLWSRFPRRLLLHAAELIARSSGSLRGALALGEIEDELSQLSLVHRTLEASKLADPGQLLATLAVHEIVRGRLPADVELDDLGTQRLGAPAVIERVFAVRQAGLLPHHLPAIKEYSPEVLFGRQELLDELRAAIDSRRVVTVVGTGGIGKTSLLRRFFLEVGDQFSGGQYWVDLSDLRRPAQFLPRVAAALETQFTNEETLFESLARTIGKQEILFVFDGTDAVWEALATFSQRLSQVCPNVQLIAVSQRRRRLANSISVLVPGLGCPIPGDHLTDIRESPAVELFESRAQQFDEGFSVNSTNAESVAELCRLVDGSPLALRILASRIRQFTPKLMVGRLKDQPLSILKDNGTEVHRTLIATAEKISDQARELLACIAVFEGAFTREALEFVCGADPYLTQHLDDLLEELLDMQLVRSWDGTKKINSYYLPAISRYLAVELLKQHANRDELKRRLKQWLKSFVDEVSPKMAFNDQLLIERFHAHFEDIRSYYLAEIRKKVNVGRLTNLLSDWSIYFNQYSLFYALIELVDTSIALHDMKAISPLLLNARANAAIRIGDIEGARVYGRATFRMAKELGEMRNVSRGLHTLSLAEQDAKLFRRAYRYSQMAISINKVHGDAKALAANYTALCNSYIGLGRFNEAVAACKDALELMDPSLHSWWMLSLETVYAWALVRSGNTHDAWRAIVRAIRLLQNQMDSDVLSRLYNTACWAATDQGNFVLAARLLATSQVLNEKYGVVLSPMRVSTRKQVTERIQENFSGLVEPEKSDFLAFLLECSINGSDQSGT